MIDASRGGRVKQQPAWRPPADKALIQRPRELDIVLVPGGSLRHASRLPSANYCTGPARTTHESIIPSLAAAAAVDCFL